ncbi:N-acetyltransferase [Methylobacterium sp. Leaf91]|uniref:GNAT family N-acetyltransferase n=1 Tax=Methylobacterium sp. Leaf91 TaxID=1736247 RepID=UPI0009EA2F7A|nr:N-acetyltransferase [Methylobacterium sp. Leaf91]
MNVVVTVRREHPRDAETIAQVVQRAYADVPYSDHREHIMVDLMRASDAYIPELSLLAEVNGEAVGHVLLTKAHIGFGYSAFPTLALAPLSVVPAFQRQGISKLLISYAHDQSAALGFATILLVCIPNYYQQFGYERLSRCPIKLPFDAPDANCMILPLKPGALDGVSGIVCYAEGWLEH